MKKVISILAVLLVLALSVMPVLAESVDSPHATTADYDITIIVPDGGGSGTYTYVTDVDDDGHQIVRFIATPDPGFEFTGWEFSGKFTTDGDVKQPTVELDIIGDISAIPHFEKIGETKAPEQPTVKPIVDNGDKSPQTGSDSLVLFSVLALCAVAGAVALTVAKKASK